MYLYEAREGDAAREAVSLSWPKTPSVPLVVRKEHEIQYHRSYWL